MKWLDIFECPRLGFQYTFVLFSHELCFLNWIFGESELINCNSVAQSVERATPGKEVPGSIPAVAACSLLVGSVSVECDRLRQKSWSPNSVSCVVARKIVRRSVSGPVRDIA